VLEEAIKDLTHILLRDQLKGGSTCGYTNANTEAQRAAASQLLARLTSLAKA